jgi:hypothetical protein
VTIGNFSVSATAVRRSSRATTNAAAPGISRFGNIRTTVGDRADNNEFEFAVQGRHLSDSNLGEEDTLSYDTGANQPPHGELYAG